MNKNERPVAWEIVNAAKRTQAVVDAVQDITGDRVQALDTFTELPMTIAPGSGFPVAVSRSVGNSFPTVVELTWREQSIGRSAPKKKVSTQTLYL